MQLALGSARADRAPADQSRQILRRDHVKKLRAGRHAHLGQVEEQVPRQPQAIVDLVRLIEMRVVDQAFPSHRGARLLKVDTHYDVQVRRELIDRGLQAAGVFAGRINIVHRAWPGDHQQPPVAGRQNLQDLRARVGYGFRGSFGDRQLLLQEHGRKNYLGPLDAKVVDGSKHGLQLI